MLGETNALTDSFTEINGSEKLVLAIIVILVIGIGIYPQPILNLSEAAVTELINQVSLK